jgi:hypothetical protein
MNIYKAIAELKEEKRRLDRAIAVLEARETAGDDRPSRRSWNAEARSAAAERMRKYWEKRKQNASHNGAS